MVIHSRMFHYADNSHIEVLQPHLILINQDKMVWALAVSLTATYAIFINFYSSGYLDVSVPRVSSHILITLINQNTWDVGTP